MPNNIIGTLLLTIILSTALLTLGVRSLYVNDIKPLLHSFIRTLKNLRERQKKQTKVDSMKHFKRFKIIYSDGTTESFLTTSYAMAIELAERTARERGTVVKEVRG